MLGLNRTGGYLRGFPITLPHSYGNQVNIVTHNFGNPVTLSVAYGNPVIEPKNYGNPVPLYPTTYVAGSTPPSPPSSEDDILLEDGDSIELEDGSGNILLEN
jgi:hypothetical protein